VLSNDDGPACSNAGFSRYNPSRVPSSGFTSLQAGVQYYLVIHSLTQSLFFDCMPPF